MTRRLLRVGSDEWRLDLLAAAERACRRHPEWSIASLTRPRSDAGSPIPHRARSREYQREWRARRAARAS